MCSRNGDMAGSGKIRQRRNLHVLRAFIAHLDRLLTVKILLVLGKAGTQRVSARRKAANLQMIRPLAKLARDALRLPCMLSKRRRQKRLRAGHPSFR